MSLALDWPYALALLPLPILVIRYLPACTSQASEGLIIPFFKTLKEFSTQKKLGGKKSSPYLISLVLIWVLFIIGLASPYHLGEPLGIPTLSRNLILALDTSESMSIKDMTIKGRYVDRMSMVKKIASDFIRERQGDQLGLILFGSNAYLQSPLTPDLKTVEAFLQETQIGLAGKQTAIGNAIGLSIKHFKKVSNGQKVLILITDGEDNASVIPVSRIVSVAKEHQIKIYTIGVGSQAIGNHIDEQALQEIAKQTYGQYFRAADTQGLESIFAVLNEIEPVLGKEQWYQHKTYLYPYFLGVALLLSLMMALYKLIIEFKYDTTFFKT